MASPWCCHGDTKVLFRSVVLRRLRQTELAGAGDGLGPPLDLELAEDPAVVAFDRVQGEEQSCPNLLIGESLTDEPQDFQLALA